MKILVDAGLIERDKRGLWVWYRPVPSRLDALRSVHGWPVVSPRPPRAGDRFKAAAARAD